MDGGCEEVELEGMDMKGDSWQIGRLVLTGGEIYFADHSLAMCWVSVCCSPLLLRARWHCASGCGRDWVVPPGKFPEALQRYDSMIVDRVVQWWRVKLYKDRGEKKIKKITLFLIWMMKFSRCLKQCSIIPFQSMAQSKSDTLSFTEVSQRIHFTLFYVVFL